VPVACGAHLYQWVWAVVPRLVSSCGVMRGGRSRRGRSIVTGLASGQTDGVGVNYSDNRSCEGFMIRPLRQRVRLPHDAWTRTGGVGARQTRAAAPRTLSRARRDGSRASGCCLWKHLFGGTHVVSHTDIWNWRTSLFAPHTRGKTAAHPIRGVHWSMLVLALGCTLPGTRSASPTVPPGAPLEETQNARNCKKSRLFTRLNVAYRPVRARQQWNTKQDSPVRLSAMRKRRGWGWVISTRWCVWRVAPQPGFAMEWGLGRSVWPF